MLADTGLSDWPKGPKPWDSHTKQSKRVNDSRARSTLVVTVPRLLSPADAPG